MTTDTMATPTVQPAVRGGISPYLNIDGASAASEFYQRAFGAEEVSRMARPDDGRLIHCHFYINGASVLMSDPFPEHGYPAEVPAAFNLNINLGPTTISTSGSSARWRRAAPWRCRSRRCFGATGTVRCATRSACSGR
jgi:hypothetical protein